MKLMTWEIEPVKIWPTEVGSEYCHGYSSYPPYKYGKPMLPAVSIGATEKAASALFTRDLF